MKPNDEVLVAGILEKNEESILRFVETYQDRVYCQAHRMLGNSQDAEEACQDVFMKALKRMGDFEGRSKLSTWLYRITYTTCLDVLKKRKRKTAEVEIDHALIPSWMHLEDALSQMESEEQRKTIDRAILQLDEKDALLIDLFHLRQTSIKEIEEIMGMTAGSIKVRLLRARKKLAVHLENLLPIETLNLYKNELR